MKTYRAISLKFAGFLALFSLVLVNALPVRGQAISLNDQRNALKLVRTHVSWLKNATLSATSYGSAGYDKVWRNYQDLRQAYNLFKQTLTMQQWAYGANELAELDAGLNIIQEAFTNCQQDVNAGRSVNMALGNMCRVLRQGADIWLQEFNRVAAKLRAE